MRPFKRLLRVELKRVEKTLNLLNSLRRSLDNACPVCEQAHKMREFSCGCPMLGMEPSLCPAGKRCKSFVTCTNELDIALSKAGWTLKGLHATLEKQSSCDHEWTADQNNQCNICIKCYSQKDHFS